MLFQNSNYTLSEAEKSQISSKWMKLSAKNKNDAIKKERFRELETLNENNKKNMSNLGMPKCQILKSIDDRLNHFSFFHIFKEIGVYHIKFEVKNLNYS